MKQIRYTTRRQRQIQQYIFLLNLGPTHWLSILNGLREIYEDPTSTKAEKMKAADLMSKNMGLQTQKVESTAKIVVINIDDEDDDNTD